MKFFLSLLAALALTSAAWANEPASPFTPDPPLPFDVPSAAPPLKKVQRPAVRKRQAKKTVKAKPAAKGKQSAKTAQKKTLPKKTATKKAVGKAPKISAAKKPPLKKQAKK